MKAGTKNMIKNVAFIGGVSLLTSLVVNSLAKRNTQVARLRNTVQTGV